jgi:predicted HTH transcriptional regulator
VIGTKPDRVNDRVTDAAKLVSPQLDLPVETVKLDGKNIVVVTVPRGDESPYLANGEIVVRGHGRNQRITDTAIVQRATQRSQTTADLTREVKRLAEVVVTLNDQVVTSRGWRPRITDMILGGIVGAVISLALAWGVAAIS